MMDCDNIVAILGDMRTCYRMSWDDECDGNCPECDFNHDESEKSEACAEAIKIIRMVNTCDRCGQPIRKNECLCEECKAWIRGKMIIETHKTDPCETCP